MMKASEFIAILKKIANGDYGRTNYGDAYHKVGGAKSIGGWSSALGAFMFDCCGLLKAVLWGWSGDKTATYGGAIYISNSVPDIDDQGFHDCCSMKQITDISEIPVGAVLWKQGHVGCYIGGGNTVECTTNGNASVQFGTVGNNGVRTVSGESYGSWTMWGKMPYLDYDVKEVSLNYKVDDRVTICGIYASSESTKCLMPSIKEGVINRINSGAANPYLIYSTDGKTGIGWTNEKYMAMQTSISVLTASDKLAVARAIVDGTDGWSGVNGTARKTKLTELYGSEVATQIQELINKAFE